MLNESNMKTEKLTLTKVYISEKDKEGRPIILNTKNGPKTVKRIGIKTVEYKDDWLNSVIWTDKSPLNFIKEGDVLTAIISEYNGNLQFNLPRPEEELKMKVDELDERLKIVEGNQRNQAEGKPMYPPHTPINPDEIPF